MDASLPESSLSAVCVGPAIACQMDVHGLYSVRSRFGWVIDQAMLYGTAGLAVATWDSSAVNVATARQLASESLTSYGVAVGAGIEYKLTPHLGVRSEVIHYGLSSRDQSIPGIGAIPNQLEIHRRPRRHRLVFQLISLAVDSTVGGVFAAGLAAWCGSG